MLERAGRQSVSPMRLSGQVGTNQLVFNRRSRTLGSLTRKPDDLGSSVIINKRNQFLKVLQINEFRRLLLCSCIFQAAALLLAFIDVPDGDDLDSHRAEYEYGATLLAGTIGLITDAMLRGRYLFTLLAVAAIISITIHIIASIVFFVSGNDSVFTTNADYWILGYIQALVYFL